MKFKTKTATEVPKMARGSAGSKYGELVEAALAHDGDGHLVAEFEDRKQAMNAAQGVRNIISDGGQKLNPILRGNEVHFEKKAMVKRSRNGSAPVAKKPVAKKATAKKSTKKRTPKKATAKKATASTSTTN